MSKQLAIAAFNAVEQRVANRGDFYTEEGRMARMLTCAQLAQELRRGDNASFRRMWGSIQRGIYWEAAEDALGEVFDELGLTDIDHLYKFVTEA